MEKQLLTLKEVAERLGMSQSWVYAMARTGRIASIRFGSVYRFAPEEVARILREGVE